MTGFPNCGAHLPLSLFAWLFKVPMLAQVRQDAGFLTLFFEPLERPIEALVIVDDDFWHSLISPLSTPEGASVRIGSGIYRV
jgi:hypothetical protein